jgi:transposase
MLTEVRQRATRDARGRKRDPEWAGRRRLLTAHERLTPEAFAKLWNSLIDAGDPGIEILHAYTVKESLRQLLDLAGTHPDREAISHRLWRFYDQAASSSSPEVHRLAATIETWWARGRGRHHHRALQRPIRGLQPSRETPGTQRLRIPQRREPAPTHTVGMHSSTPTSLS